MPPDARLQPWDQLQATEWTGLLVGNGASRAVWRDFGYESLFQVAQQNNIENQFTQADVALFESFQTTNFEEVLSALLTASKVSAAIGQPHADVRAHYERIRLALIEAVRAKHIPWLRVPDEVLASVRNAIRTYRHIYSTNYDLLIYWALMHQPGGFKDYFWGPDGTFNLSNVDVHDNDDSLVHYLHGGLHLYRTPNGRTLKRQAEQGANLLDLFSTPLAMEPQAVPLFISEGSSENKLKAIYRSDYLAFSYFKLAEHEGPLCVFGNSLGNSDRHIVSAIKKAGMTNLGVAIRQTDPDGVIAAKARWQELFPRLELQFYAAATHPLGHPDLLVAP